jgi:hypothetical protein
MSVEQELRMDEMTFVHGVDTFKGGLGRSLRVPYSHFEALSALR